MAVRKLSRSRELFNEALRRSVGSQSPVCALHGGILDLPAAQTDEIQVYDVATWLRSARSILTLHNNYVANGLKGQPLSGRSRRRGQSRGMAFQEWAYGVTTWFEAGLYLPLYSHDDTMGWGINGMKLRTLVRRACMPTNVSLSMASTSNSATTRSGGTPSGSHAGRSGRSSVGI